ncbi:ABC transporter substrate-binding protein [Candidatus Aerophobetes bacterium]|nr:ABC transporter substrate-binding protein [Candidatus Aerophobetes bacterium]
MKKGNKPDEKVFLTALLTIASILICINVLSGMTIAKTKVTLVDSAGREVTIPYPVERIIVTDDTVADVVRLFGRQRCVVGIEESIPRRGYFPEMSNKVVTGNQWRGLNWEKVLQLKPDVILMSDHPACTSRLTRQASRFNIPVLVLRWRFPKGQDETVRILGKAFGEEQRAREFIEWKKDKLRIVREKVKSLKAGEKLKAYLEVAFSGPVGRAAGRGKPAGQVMEMAGLRNICEFQKNKEVSAEWIIEKNPDIIIMCDYAGGAGGITGYLATDTSRIVKYIEEIKRLPRFKRTNAVKENNVYVMNTKLRGSMYLIGILYLAKAAYPEIFRDIDPKGVLREFFEKWMNVKYQGIWFYPEP